MAKAPTNQELLGFVGELLAEASSLIARRYGHTGALRFKTGDEAVTAADVEVEALLRDRILDRYPGHRVVGEELGEAGTAGSEWSWHIDPIDGTLNFALGVPLFSSTVGVLRGSELVAGGVVDPLRNELYVAARGEGAWRDGARLAVSERDRLREAVVSLQSSRKGRFVRDRELLHQVHTLPMKSRRLGSIALELAYVACGRFDLLLAGKATAQNLYDVAGGLLLVEEAGGRVSDATGAPFVEGCIELVASNGHLHDEVLQWLRPHLGADPRPPA